MAQFDVYVIQGSNQWVVDVQNDFLNNRKTRVVIPLSQAKGQQVDRLMPVINVSGRQMVLLTLSLTSVPVHVLGEVIDHLGSHQRDIVDAIDFMMFGF